MLAFIAESGGKTKMTAFNAEEHGMMRGIWGELETINRSLTLLVELLEHQEQEPQERAACAPCIMPCCPNPRYTKSGHCHYHRYLRSD